MLLLLLLQFLNLGRVVLLARMSSGAPRRFLLALRRHDLLLHALQRLLYARGARLRLRGVQRRFFSVFRGRRSELRLVLLQNAWGQPLEDPLVVEAVFRGQPFQRVPLQALRNKVHE
jgi:hypothetical protein